MNLQNAALRRIRQLLPLMLTTLACLSASPLSAATFTVNSPADLPDFNQGDGVCETETGNGVCTLRAAVMEANALPGADTITLQAGVTYLLSRAGTDPGQGALDIADDVTINGAGATSTVIDGNSAVLHSSVFYIEPCHDQYSVCNAEHPPVTITLHGLLIRNGNSGNGGIGNAGDLTIDHCAIVDNYSPYDGAGISNYGTGRAMIVGSTISGNKAATSSIGWGGGVYNAGTMKIVDTTISGNSATLGGGIANALSSIVAVVDSTISGNFSDADGGGIFSDGIVTLNSVTITENLANADDSGSAVGGGVAQAAGSVSVTNSIIAGNSLDVHMTPFPLLDDNDCSGTLTSAGNNIVYAKPATCTINGPVLLAYPYLGPLQNNGGPTLTHAIPPYSPAIDGGSSGGCTDDLGAPLNHDQRGVARPQSARCDIGAFESTEVIFRDYFET